MPKCHIHVSIAGALRMAHGSRSDQAQVKRVLGFEDLRLLKRELLFMQEQGYSVIPSENCDNQAASGECLGHEVESVGN